MYHSIRTNFEPRQGLSWPLCRGSLPGGPLVPRLRNLPDASAKASTARSVLFCVDSPEPSALPKRPFPPSMAVTSFIASPISLRRFCLRARSLGQLINTCTTVVCPLLGNRIFVRKWLTTSGRNASALINMLRREIGCRIVVGCGYTEEPGQSDAGVRLFSTCSIRVPILGYTIHLGSKPLSAPL